jgi:predicted methyltransferase
MKALKIAALALLAAAPLAAEARPADVRAALAAPGRPADRTALDAVRRPVEVLAFMGLERGDRALDYFTGSGYYAEIMAAAVGPEGLVVGWNSAAFGRNERVVASLNDIRARHSNTVFYATPATALAFAPASFDFAMLHLVYHDAYWESAQFGLPRIDPNSVTRALFDALKPGGIVAVIDHYAPAGGGDTREVVEKLHRIDPAVVKADFERAGFVLEAESDLLRTPEDDRSRNVFDPAIRGKTDRFVFRFRKPAP